MKDLLEATKVYDELRRQGWSEQDALEAAARPKSLAYAQARFSAELRNLGEIVTETVRTAFRRKPR